MWVTHIEKSINLIGSDIGKRDNFMLKLIFKLSKSVENVELYMITETGKGANA